MLFRISVIAGQKDSYYNYAVLLRRIKIMEESRSWKIYKEIQETVKRISYEFNLEMLVFTEDVWIKNV